MTIHHPFPEKKNIDKVIKFLEELSSVIYNYLDKQFQGNIANGMYY